jgi:hypothetical protein
MANTNLSPITSARSPLAVEHGRNLPANIVEDELSWRSLPRSAQPSTNPMVVATRWRSFGCIVSTTDGLTLYAGLPAKSALNASSLA